MDLLMAADSMVGEEEEVVAVVEEEQVSMIMPEVEQEGLEVPAVLQRSVTYAIFLVSFYFNIWWYP
jgi:hypothetical protein